MQNDENQVAALMAKIARLELRESALFQLVESTNFIEAMIRQKDDWFQKHYPAEYAQCNVNLDACKIARKRASLTDFDPAYMAYLN